MSEGLIAGNELRKAGFNEDAFAKSISALPPPPPPPPLLCIEMPSEPGLVCGRERDEFVVGFSLLSLSEGGNKDGELLEFKDATFLVFISGCESSFRVAAVSFSCFSFSTIFL